MSIDAVWSTSDHALPLSEMDAVFMAYTIRSQTNMFRNVQNLVGSQEKYNIYENVDRRCLIDIRSCIFAVWDGCSYHGLHDPITNKNVPKCWKPRCVRRHKKHIRGCRSTLFNRHSIMHCRRLSQTRLTWHTRSDHKQICAEMLKTS